MSAEAFAEEIANPDGRFSILFGGVMSFNNSVQYLQAEARSAAMTPPSFGIAFVEEDKVNTAVMLDRAKGNSVEGLLLVVANEFCQCLGHHVMRVAATDRSSNLVMEIM